jgi:hypothetical protein
MVRLALSLCVGIVIAFQSPIAEGDWHRDVCRVATDQRPHPRGILGRRRAARANRSAAAAQSFPAELPDRESDREVELEPKTAVFDAAPSDTPHLPREDTEVWPQASALFPAE